MSKSVISSSIASIIWVDYSKLNYNVCSTTISKESRIQVNSKQWAS
jgi:hypothetical protein